MSINITWASVTVSAQLHGQPPPSSICFLQPGRRDLRDQGKGKQMNPVPGHLWDQCRVRQRPERVSESGGCLPLGAGLHLWASVPLPHPSLLCCWHMLLFLPACTLFPVAPLPSGSLALAQTLSPAARLCALPTSFHTLPSSSLFSAGCSIFLLVDFGFLSFAFYPFCPSLPLCILCCSSDATSL